MNKKSSVQLYFCKKRTLITKGNALLWNSQMINVFVVMEITQVTVAILLSNILDCEIISQFIDIEGKLILQNINIKDNIFTIVCLHVYAPNYKITNKYLI